MTDPTTGWAVILLLPLFWPLLVSVSVALLSNPKGSAVMDTIDLRNYTLESVRYFYDNGVITQDQWEGYAHAWRTGAPRFGSELALYAQHDFTTDGARAVAEELGCCKWQESEVIVSGN